METLSLRIFGKLSMLLFLLYVPSKILAQVDIKPDERLSQWLFQHQAENTYPLGLMWMVPSEKPTQAELKQHLLDQLSQCLEKTRTLCKKEQLSGLISQLNQFPITGRAPVAKPDPLWLALHPAQNPVLGMGQSVQLPKRPQSVTVLMNNGQLCQVPFLTRATADFYIKQCLGSKIGVDYAWIAQPDGSSVRYGIAMWNEEAQEPPAPGAWIWAPSRSSDIKLGVSDEVIQFLATQGTAEDRPRDRVNVSFPHPELPPHLSRKRNAALTANDWGIIGLLQMPSAHMEKISDVRLQLTNTYPYRIGALLFQPFDFLEAGFHYARVATQLYDPSQRISNLALYDKGFSLKLRLLKESAYFPQLALGGQDVAGTGNFSGEYLVASKRMRSFDWTLGVAWGNLGARSNIPNPFGANAADRTNAHGMGGEFNLPAYFHGATSLFGGVQWQTPWDPLLLKLEYDSSYYRIGLLEKYRPQRSPINFGLVYRLFPRLDISGGIERGNTFMLGVTLHTALNDLKQEKLFDPPPPPIQPFNLEKLDSATAPIQTEVISGTILNTNWARISTEINGLTGWSVVSIAIDDSALRVQIDGAGSSFGGSRLNTLIAVLHRSAPAYVTHFEITFVEYGMKLDAKSVNRTLWVTEHTEALPPSLDLPSIESFSPPFTPRRASDKFIWRSDYLRFSGAIAPIFSQSMGGPDSFFLYQAGVYGSGELKFNQSTSLTGTVALRVIDNYKHYVYDGPTQLPRVRTNVRQYIETSWNTIPNLQVTHAKQVSTNQFISVYGGLLESMFAGVGSEWLYRPWHSPFAVSIDINYVQQREFAQHFDFQDYRVATGQVTVYWDTGWNGLLAQVSAGQYLAGDRGVGIDISRRFDNGVIVGAYATKTNVSAVQFGEGSFNKGVYISVPFDTVLPISTPGAAYFNWQPLLRDGGAELNRAITLYGLTSERDRDGSYFDR